MILHLDVTGLKYRRPGLNKISFVAHYVNYIRRGTLVYDTINKKFLTHRSDIDLLIAICERLRQPVCYKK